MEETPSSAPRPTSILPLVLLVLLFMGLSAAGIYLYQARQDNDHSPTDLNGFDIAQTDGPRAPNSQSPAAGRPTQSSLNMITGATPGMRVGSAVGGQNQAAPPAQTFAELCRKAEGKTQKLGENYTRRYPIIQQYGRDWMSHPDLKKINDDYFKDHDPVRFLRGLAASPSFPILVKKYASNGAIQAFAKDAVRQAPAGLASAGMDVVNQDGTLKKLMDNVVGALGFPPGLFSGSSESGKIDQKAVMDSIMKSNPDMQKALANPEVQKGLQQNQ